MRLKSLQPGLRLLAWGPLALLSTLLSPSASAAVATAKSSDSACAPPPASMIFEASYIDTGRAENR